MEEESGFLENDDMEYDDCAVVMYMPNLFNNQAKGFLTLWLIFLLSYWYRSLKCQIHLHFLQQVGHEPCEFPESLLLVDRIMPFLLSPCIGTDNEMHASRGCAVRDTHGLIYEVCPGHSA